MAARESIYITISSMSRWYIKSIANLIANNPVEEPLVPFVSSQDFSVDILWLKQGIG